MQVSYARRFWQDGALIESADLPAAAQGYGLADGVFETIAFRALEGSGQQQSQPEFWDLHWERLREAMQFFELSCSYDSDSLQAAVLDLVEGLDRRVEYRLSLTVVRSGRGSSVSLLAAPIQLSGEEVFLQLSPIIRPAGNPSTRYKTLSYTDALTASRQVGRGQMPLQVNQWGRIASAAFGNVYCRMKDHWATPAVAEGALPGVIRRLLLEGQSSEVRGMELLDGLPVREAALDLATMHDGEWLFSNSLRGLVRAQMV